jgi:hypothetical protein
MNTAANFQAVSKTTGEILAESWCLAALEERYADHGHWVYLRNAHTGVEWDLPETDYQDE